MAQRIEGGSEDAEVARIDDHLHCRIFCGDLAEDCNGTVTRTVVSKDVLSFVSGQLPLEQGAHGFVTGPDIILLVEAGRDNGNLLFETGLHENPENSRND